MWHVHGKIRWAILRTHEIDMTPVGSLFRRRNLRADGRNGVVR